MIQTLARRGGRRWQAAALLRLLLAAALALRAMGTAGWALLLPLAAVAALLPAALAALALRAMAGSPWSCWLGLSGALARAQELAHRGHRCSASCETR